MKLFVLEKVKTHKSADGDGLGVSLSARGALHLECVPERVSLAVVWSQVCDTVVYEKD